MADGTTHVLFPNEAEIQIQSLNITSIENVGDKRWWSSHKLIEKLNMQAIINVTSDCDEFIKDYLISFNKVCVLIYELIVAELWTEKIYPLLKHDIDTSVSTLPVYMALFHEATVMSLLETSFFYKDVCEAAGDSIIDVVDYINRKITMLVLDNTEPDEKNESELSEDEILQNQYRTIQFTTQMKSLSIMRYISDAIECMSLSAISRMLDTHDFPSLLVQVLDKHPWRRTFKGTKQNYNNNKWVNVARGEERLIAKIEGQVWLTLYQLLMHPESQRKYEYSSHRKTQILKLRRYFNEVLLDQLPHLKDLQIFVEHLAVIEAPIVKQNLVIEQVSEIRLQLVCKYKGKWKAIAAKQLKESFSLDADQMKEQANMLAETYNLGVLESLLDEPPVCANCHGEAMKRCSRCQIEWYCSRPCQVKHWAKHKSVCNMLMEKEKK